MSFMQMRAIDRLNALKKLIPDFDFAANERDRRVAYDARRDVGGDYKRDKALLDSMPPQPDKRPATVDPSEIAEQLRIAEAQNYEAVTLSARKTDLTARAAMIENEISELRKRIKGLSAELITLQEQADAIEAPERIDTIEMHDRLSQAEAFNRAAGAFDAYLLQQETLDRHQSELRRLDGVIEQLDEDKRQAVRKAELPVADLSFGADDVEIDGLPFEQASSSQQLMVSTAITMALRPTIKIILVREAPLLDDEHICMLAEVAEKHGYQCWLERLISDKEVGIVIEDGEIVDGQKATPASATAASAAQVSHPR
jgi:hypothetical protein